MKILLISVLMLIGLSTIGQTQDKPSSITVPSTDRDTLYVENHAYKIYTEVWKEYKGDDKPIIICVDDYIKLKDIENRVLCQK